MDDEMRPVHGPVAVPRIDTSVPHSARFWNYLVGGKDNFEADRAAARIVLETVPSLASIARSGREFLGRAVRFLTAEAGLRQFLDIGTGIPTADNTHEVAQRVAPDARIVYVDNDPIVLVHARSLLPSTPEGATDFIDADIRDPDLILREAARTLDFGRPVGLMLVGILNFVTDDSQASALVARLLAAVPSGSYLVVQHPASEDEALVEATRRWSEMGADPLVCRSRAEVARFFDGLILLEPGVVTLNEWRPEPSTQTDVVPSYAAVGRKP